MHEPILGVWTLQGFYLENVETGERSEPFGAAPRGTMMFHPDGHMTTVLTPRRRPAPVSEADQAAAFQQMIAYAGPFRLEADRFIVKVEVSWFEPWIGTEQVRTIKFSDDRMDVISTPTSLPQPGGTVVSVVGILSWKRYSAKR